MGLDNPLHIAFLLVILLLVFGAKRLPEMGRSLGSGLRGFKESINGEPDHVPEVSSVSATPVQSAETVGEHPPIAPVQPAGEPVPDQTPSRPVA